MYITTADQFEVTFEKIYQMMKNILNSDMDTEDKQTMFNHFMMDFYHCGYGVTSKNMMLELLTKVSDYV